MRFLRQKPFFWEFLQCLILDHEIPENHLVEFMAAVYHGGICGRCYRVVRGKFLCNMWDESQTEVVDGVEHLKGLNPILKDERWVFLGNLETLEEDTERVLQGAGR